MAAPPGVVTLLPRARISPAIYGDVLLCELRCAVPTNCSESDDASDDDDGGGGGNNGGDDDRDDRENDGSDSDDDDRDDDRGDHEDNGSDASAATTTTTTSAATIATTTATTSSLTQQRRVFGAAITASTNMGASSTEAKHATSPTAVTAMTSVGGVTTEPPTATTTALVAVKTVSLSRARAVAAQACSRAVDDPAQEQRVARMLLVSGGHRHIVQPVCHFVDGDTLFLVSEYCGGGDLQRYLAAGQRERGSEGEMEEESAIEDDSSGATSKPINERVASRIMRQVLLGVQFLHAHGVAHRDLSLENVLLTRDGECKIADFGLSTDARRACRECVGKDYYMAPEVVACARAGAEADADAEVDAYDPTKADVWSLGIMWFIMLTGSPLVSIASVGESAFRAFARHGVAAVLDAWGFGAAISPRTVELLARMLEIDPTARISVVDALAHEALKTSCVHEDM